MDVSDVCIALVAPEELKRPVPGELTEAVPVPGVILEVLASWSVQMGPSACL